jgi:hypothetical protein
MAQVDQEMREGEANVMTWFAWLVAAQRRQRRAAELSGGDGKNREEKELHGELEFI